MDLQFELTSDNDIALDLPIEPPSRLVPLPILPWRSLGGYLNYEGWKERQRFVELDQAIALSERRTKASRYPLAA